MKKTRTVAHTSNSPLVNMGEIRLRQPIPNGELQQVDPFILLHHYGPYAISKFNNPFDLGPHPHRGFEPITLLYKGEQLHRDSLGNEMLVKAGDVQWTTAGRGIIHAEGPTKEFVLRGGELEGIQLWLNLPAVKKMIPASYQHVKAEQFSVVTSVDENIEIKVISGALNKKYGLITAQTSVNVFMGKSNGVGEMEIELPNYHNALVYLLDGELIINDSLSLKKGAMQFVTFETDGDTIKIASTGESNFLILSGEPINEKMVQHGPYVMNSQTEIMEAMRDFNMGKMGYLY